MAEISEFQYAYFNSGAEMIRIKIPMMRNSFEPELKLVFSNPSQPLPTAMGLFSHNHIVYMVGGYYRPEAEADDGIDDEAEAVDEDDYGIDDDDGIDDGVEYLVEYGYQYGDLVHMFDPTKFHEIPLENIEPLENLKCAPMVLPEVIRAEDRIYLLSKRDFFCNRYRFDMNGERLDVFRFQYFDPNKNLLETLPPPPLPTDREMQMNIGLLSVRCHFFFRGYIYVSITDTYTCFQTSKFNTRKSEWEDCKSLVDRFEEKNIPFPFFCVGNIGISDEFVDNAWILVALNGPLPTAYHVCLTDKGDIDPISHRVLGELYTSGVDMHCSETDWKQLADMGSGRFCVMCCTLDDDFLIYGFKIDFKVEQTIQSNKTEDRSSHVIFKMRFNRNGPIPLKHSLTGFCIASAPPPHLASPDNEDQDKNDRKSKRKRGSRLFGYLFPALLLLFLLRR